MDETPQDPRWFEIEQAQERIRDAVFRMGMAARLHVGKAFGLLDKPDPFESNSLVIPFDDDDQAAAYLADLPELNKRTRAEDIRCASLWEPGGLWFDEDEYAREQDKLAGLFLKFRFTLRSYERLVRQPDKPLLDQARQLSEEVGSSEEIDRLESLLRLRLRDFIALEDAIADELRRIDAVRAELVASFGDFARRMAETIAGSDPEAIRFANCGVIKAAEYYDPRRGYTFESYAEFWVEKAIHDQKTWGLMDG